MQVQVLGHADIIIMSPLLCYIIFSQGAKPFQEQDGYLFLYLLTLGDAYSLISHLRGERLRDYAAQTDRIMVQQSDIFTFIYIVPSSYFIFKFFVIRIEAS